MNINNILFSLSISPWPLILTINLISSFFNLIFFLNIKFNIIFIFNIIININIILIWLINLFNNNNLIRYTNKYLKLTKISFLILFISSEIMFFLTFFYINFSFSIFNNFNINFNSINIFNLNLIIALINSIILITSRLTIILTTQFNLIFKKKINNYLNLTIILGLYFIIIQIFEYKILLFNISNSIIISNFFILTSFHIFHVIIGIIIIIIWKKIKNITINNLNLKIKIINIYWHFIDLIWIFIFILIY